MVRRALALGRYGAGRIYVEDDVDGLSSLLAGDARVTVWEPDRTRYEWLAALSREVILLEDVPDHEVDLAVVHAGSPAATQAALDRALRVTRPGGHIAVSVRVPWEWVLYPQLEAAGLPVVSYERAVDHWLLPCGQAVDGAGDLVVVERPAAAKAPQGLDGAGDLVAVERPAAAKAPQDSDGAGDLVAVERPAAAKAPQVEYVAVYAAYELFADDATRTRPLRTRRWHEETIFG